MAETLGAQVKLKSTAPALRCERQQLFARTRKHTRMTPPLCFVAKTPRPSRLRLFEPVIHRVARGGHEVAHREEDDRVARRGQRRIDISNASLAMCLHLGGTFLTFMMVPRLMFQADNLLLLTTDGEFVVKNLVLITAGLVLLTHTRRPT